MADSRQGIRSAREYPDYYAFVLCLARSGVRLGEAVALEWRDVDFDRRVLLIRRSERRGRVSVPKSGKARRVEMSRQLARVLADRKSFQEAEAALAGHAAPPRVFLHPGTATPIRDDAWQTTCGRRCCVGRPRAARAPLPCLHPGGLRPPAPAG